MIKAEELMLGDWLKYGIDRIVKVTALYGSMVETLPCSSHRVYYGIINRTKDRGGKE